MRKSLLQSPYSVVFLLFAVLGVSVTAYAADSVSAGEFWRLLTEVDGAKVKDLAAQHLWLALLLCFASGILTSLTPCIYPMIPITINIFGRAARAGKDASGAPDTRKFNTHTFFLACVYVAGMCATYSIMGVVAGLTGSLFGKVLQSSWVLGFLTLLFFALSLSQLGLFKLELPGAWQTKLSSFGSSDNLFGIFLMGLFSGLIVSPCVGPVIAGILAFVFDTSNAFLGFIYFLSFSLGLGVLFLVIGGFSGILAKLPRSGSWMTGINRILAALMFFAALYYGYVWAKQVGLISHNKGSELVEWTRTEAEGMKLAADKKMPAIIDFTAEWCAACHEIDELIFKNPAVAEKLKGFVAMRLDVTKESPENAELLKKYGVLSLPAIVFVASDGKVLEKPRVHGVVPVDTFMSTLNDVK